jgi:hypothetical protein
METLAEGKDAVLGFLEKDAERIAGQPGEHRLVRDDSGNLIAFIAGRSFLGTGSYSVGGKRLLVVDGLVVQFDQE